MCDTENKSVAAEIKSEQIDEYPEFPNFSDLNSSSDTGIKQEPVDRDEFSRPWETFNEPDPEPTERKIVFECRICIKRKNRFINLRKSLRLRNIFIIMRKNPKTAAKCSKLEKSSMT